MKVSIKIIFFLLLFSNVKAQDSLSLKSIDDVLAYAEKNATVLKVSNEQTALAKYQTLNAY